MAEVMAFQQALAANRSRLNARFAAARQAEPSLDGDVALHQLGALIGPAIEAVAATRPAAVDAVLDELFDLLLQLLADGVVGPEARRPVAAEAWRTLMPLVPGPVAAAPRCIAASLTNALYNLAGVPGARPDLWLATMRRTAPYCAGPDTLLKVGQVAAWLAGLAHYRGPALARCRELGPRLLDPLFGLAGERSDSDYGGILNRMSADPWLTPRTAAAGQVTRSLVLVRRAGAFRGFGGEFLAPPTVGWAEGNFYVQDGDACWLLTADAFGATFHRTSRPGTLLANAPDSPFDVRGAEVLCGKDRASFRELAALTSWAADSTTLAATSSLSHHVFLFALVAEVEPR